MALGRDDTFETANSYAADIARARAACDLAVKDMISAIVSVPDSWKSESGQALVKAMDDLRYQISMTSVRLMELEGKIKKRALSIYNNWPNNQE